MDNCSKTIVVRSQEGKKELLKHWPKFAKDILMAIGKEFGQIEQIEVRDEPTIRAMQEWNRERGKRAITESKAVLKTKRRAS